MRVSYQYRIKPNTEQKQRLNHVRRLCQYLSNRMLGDKLDWWGNNRCLVDSCSIISCPLPELRVNPNYNTHQDLLPFLKEDLILIEWSGELLDLSDVYSQVLQDTVKRVHLAFDRYIKGDKNGKRSGKPRFKSESSFKSFTYPQALDSWIKGNFIKLPKIGEIEIILHRPLPSGFKVKTCIVSKKADGWYITLSLEDKSVPDVLSREIVPTVKNSSGLDAVLDGDIFIATSCGSLLPSVKAFRKNQEKLAKISKNKSTKKKGSAKRRKLARKEAKLHQKIARSRKDHHFRTSHQLTRTGKEVFFVEDLELKNLTKRNKAKQDENSRFLPNGQAQKSGLNKSFLDAGFGQFVDILSYIVEKTGGQVIKVKPNYTSQICCNCDAYVPKELSDRIHDCKACNVGIINRDINAAANIKRVGLGVFPTIKSRRGKLIIGSSGSMSTLKEIREFTRSLHHTACS
ncbi:RNA-guided endonuclease InsQ/TnpB family protein [Tolypothrix sp. VBCCA 56010]|uniref:RNA-guided endonuclease InsQ/TnpB family protein n=1 Tax=Tolypothrix sp. VBCCA 56010 TaxID=3137731 RepID=UPI003D7CBAD9